MNRDDILRGGEVYLGSGVPPLLVCCDADQVHDSRQEDDCHLALQGFVPIVAGVKDRESTCVLGNGGERTHHQDRLTNPSQMTVVEFIEEKFAPEHIDLMRYAGRAYYQSILKQVITPEEVDRIFRRNPADPRKKLKAVPDWPYLNEKQLCEVRHEDIARIIQAASKVGYSVSTLRHIRTVIGAILSHAIREKHLTGNNPVSLVKPLQRCPKEKLPITPDQARVALKTMRYPEREFMLIGALTGLSPSEIIGLQWRHINLTTEDSSHLRVPAMTIAVRQRWYRGELDVVRRNSRRDVPICRPLLQILTELKSKSQFMGLSDFVLRSRVGTPVSHDNMMARRLLPIARRLGIPSISSRAFRWVQTVLGEELGEQFRPLG